MSTSRTSSWPRRAILVLRVVLVLVAARLVVAAISGPVVRLVARDAGLDADWDRLRIHVLRSAAEIEGLRVALAPADGAEPVPFLRVETARVDVAMRDLLGGDVRIVVAEARGVDLVVERRADGTLPVLAALIAAQEPEAREPKDDGEPAPVGFLPPARVDALRASAVRVEVRDERAWPGRAFVLDADLRADGLGHADRRGRVEARLSSPGLVDDARVGIDLELRADDAVAELDARVAGLDPRVIAPWLDEIAGGVGLVADDAVAALDGGGRVTARLRVDGAEGDGIAGVVEVADLRLEHGGRVLARLAEARVDARTLRAGLAHVGSIEVREGAIDLVLGSDGSPHALGFALRSANARPAVAGMPPAAPQAGGAFEMALDAFTAENLRVSLRDERHAPAVELGARLARLVVGGIDTRGAGRTRVDLDADLGTMAAQVGLRGEAALFGQRKSVEIEVEGRGVDLEPLAPYLADVGLVPTLRGGTLRAKLGGAGRALPGGGVEGDLRLIDAELVDGARIVAAGAVEALGASFDPTASVLRVRDLSVRGTELPLQRDASGELALLGVRTGLVASTRVTHEAAPAAAISTPSNRALPRVEIDRVAIVGNRLSWRDATLAQPVDVVFDDCGLEVEGLRLFGEPGRHERATARLKLWSRAQELVREIDVAGTIATRPGPLDLSLALSGRASGITAQRLQPYIDPTGIQERLQEAAIAGEIALDLTERADGMHANLDLREVEIRNADATVTGMRRFVVRNAVASGERLAVESVQLDGARLYVSRDPLGALLAFGFRIPLGVFQRADPGAGSGEAMQGSRTEALLADLPDVSVGSARVTAAELHWRDHAFEPALETVARLDAHAEGLATRGGEPATFAAKLDLAGSAEEVRIDGRLSLAPNAAALELDCHAQGLRAGALAAYLPPGVVCELESGELDVRAGFDVAAHPAGGLRARMALDRALVTDRAEARPLLDLGGFEAVLDRADPSAGVFEVARFVLRELQAEVRRDAQGGWHALGFRTESSPQTTSQAADELRAIPDLTPAGTPRLVLGEVDLALTRVTVTDELRDAAPVEISGRLGMPRSQVVVDADPGALPPLRVELAASVAPLARGVRVALELEPWTDEPTVRAEFTAEGISGAGVAALGRDLMTWIDGSQLTEGVAHGSIDARLAWKRRSPFDLDLRSGFAADVQLGRVELRDSPGGAVLLALDGGSAEIARVDLATGSVHAKSVELRRPELAARRTKEGVEILGLVVHPELRPSATKPAAGDEPAARAPEDSAPAARAPARGEIRVDELVVRGIDVTLRDDAADPPAVLPLDDLDVVVQRFTTRAFEEPRVVRFDAWLGAGEAQMPRPVRASNLLSGVANAVGGVLSGRDEALKYEERPVFQEALLTGRVQFVPALTGHAQATLSGFELLGFTGAAKEQGVDVGDGTVDASVRLRFRGAEGVRVDSEVVFSDLSLQEPASGPIERYLTLPVPLDTVLFLLENADGELRVPVGFTIDDEGLSRASITSAAVGATAGVIGSAIASAPLRVMSTFTDLFGITGGAEDPPPSASIAFAAGATTLSAADAAALAPLVAKMRADADWVVQVQHRLGAADVERAERLANPDPSTCRELAEGLRRRRAEIARERGELAPLVRAAWGAADARRAEDATQRLRALDAEAGNVEDALDRILDHLKPGAERHRAKRTLSAALALARARVEALREWLAAQRIEDLDERFEARPPTFDVAPGGAAGSVLAVLRERSR